MQNLYNQVLADLQLKSCGTYKNFHKKIVGNTRLEFIGVKTNDIREIAKKLIESYELVLKFPNIFYEIVTIKGYLIAVVKCPFGKRIELIDSFLPLIDNWAVCDSFVSSLKFIKKDTALFFDYIKIQLSKEAEFYKRFGLVALICYYVKDEYIDYILNLLPQTNSQFYYINMAASWLVAECYIKQREKTKILLNKKILSAFIQNKGLQKIKDSLRITKEEKTTIQKYKIN